MFEALLPGGARLKAVPPQVVARVATERWQMTAYFELRRAIFALEQGLFGGTDRDAQDEHATPIVAETSIAGMPDRVVGVVRIYHDGEGVWFGGRLGVHPDYRRVGAIGTALITEAVSTANGFGARRFLATVQARNVRYFQRHHFERIEAVDVCGRPHWLMKADLERYPPGLSSVFHRTVA